MMTTILLSAVIFLSALVGPCARNQRSATLNQEFALKAGETILVESSGVKISFAEVADDSRCPKDVTCVWAGNAKVVMSVSLSGRVADKINLNTNLDPREVTYEGYRIKLVKLDPYPVKGPGIKKSDYAVTLIVSTK